MQNVAATIGVWVSATPFRTIGSRKHCRRDETQDCPDKQVPQLPDGGGLQSALLEQPRKGSRLHDWSMGPASQTPSVGPSATFRVQAPSAQPFCLVGCPGRLQNPLGHCEAVEQTAPALVPPTQRRPPQTAPPGQSPLVLQGSAAKVAQVSQKQLLPGESLHGRLVASWVSPVVAGSKPMLRLPMFFVTEGGQS